MLVHAIKTILEQTPALDPALIERFGGRGPRYTSYPTADRFSASFDPAKYTQALLERAGRKQAPLGLYFHIPFCRSICYYCGCNKIGTKHQGKSAQYVSALQREIDLVTTVIGRGQRISHLHFGGGTPTFMLDEEFAQLFETIGSRFEMAPDGEYSIEVDPRTVTPKRLWTLRALGLNRISLGIQDFDHDVQVAVNRVQSYEDTRGLIDAAREAGFHSINVDLIYGLPRQTRESFAHTTERVIAIRPERVALFQGALTYRDKRFSGYDAATLIEVIEHLDVERLPALVRVVFAFARPRTVVVTTPNVEYNHRFSSLPAGQLRHADHRFEWTRAEFAKWAEAVGKEHGYSVRLSGIGELDDALGPPTQLAVFALGRSEGQP
jgi:hypothetical protein